MKLTLSLTVLVLSAPSFSSVCTIGSYQNGAYVIQRDNTNFTEVLWGETLVHNKMLELKENGICEPAPAVSCSFASYQNGAYLIQRSGENFSEILWGEVLAGNKMIELENIGACKAAVPATCSIASYEVGAYEIQRDGKSFSEIIWGESLAKSKLIELVSNGLCGNKSITLEDRLEAGFATGNTDREEYRINDSEGIKQSIEEEAPVDAQAAAVEA